MAGKKRFAEVKKGKKTGKNVDWKSKGGKELVDELMNRNTDAKDMSVWLKVNPTSVERDIITAIERNLGKPGFDVGIRSLYAATEGANPAVGVGLNSAFKQFGSDKLNSFKPDHRTGFNNPWEDPFGWRTRRRKNNHFQYYCNRSFFYPPAGKKPIGLTTEELATIYHFPGQVATTPSLGRIPSKRGEPPANLPI